jgi:hypothetical protein
MNLLMKILRWLRPPADPEAQAEAERIRTAQQTVKTSQLTPSGSSNLPPSLDITDPRR